MSPVARNEGSEHPRRKLRTKQDLDLVAAILSGSVDSWHAFIDRYTGLILSVLRQQLFIEDNDEIQSVYVDVLEALYVSKLREYKGKASLATWLVLVTRGKAVDYIRKKRGRRHLPRGYDNLTPYDQEIFHLHFVEGLSFEAVIHAQTSNVGPVEVEDIVASIERIVDTVDGRYLKRLHYESDARRRGINAGKLAEHLYHAEAELWESSAPRTPDQALSDNERRWAIERMEDLKARLPALDRELLALRYEEGRTAREISEQLDMGGQRKVFTALDRALKRLRVLFFEEHPEADAASEKISAKNRKKNR